MNLDPLAARFSALEMTLKDLDERVDRITPPEIKQKALRNRVAAAQRDLQDLAARIEALESRRKS